MERTISVSTDVFAQIWSLREEGENSEDAILRRVLAAIPRRKRVQTMSNQTKTGGRTPRSKVTWRDDVRTALEQLNGRAPLLRIYNEVRELRRANGRSIPPSFEPVVRRTLEEHCSASEVYRGGPDLFYMPEGKGMGVWALR
jgi:hypothetical protein